MPYVTLYSQIGQRKPMSSRLLTTTAIFATVKCPKSHKSSVGEGLNKQTHVPVTGIEQKFAAYEGVQGAEHSCEGTAQKHSYHALGKIH